MPRVFTIEEANELIPALQLEWARIFRMREEIEPLLQMLGGEDEAWAMAMVQGEVPTPPGREAEMDRLRKLIAELGATVQRLNDAGCLVKDLELGLVDFHGMHEGQQVLLCWQYGEPAVMYWHPMDEGFRARRPLDAASVPLVH